MKNDKKLKYINQHSPIFDKIICKILATVKNRFNHNRRKIKQQFKNIVKVYTKLC